MNLHSPDQDLLLLAHGELPLAPRVMTQAHVAFCRRCQARLAKMTGASRLWADAIRGSGLPQWSSPAPQRLIVTARVATAWRLGLLLVVVLTSLTVTRGLIIAGQRSPSVSAPQRAPSGGCRPDLPSDKCR